MLKRTLMALAFLALPALAHAQPVDATNSKGVFDSPTFSKTGTLGALNAKLAIVMSGRQSASVQITSTDLDATVDFQCSLDGGITYVTTGNGCGAWGGDQADGDVFFNFNQTFVFDGAPHTTVFQFGAAAGVTNWRVIVSAYTSGSASAIITAANAPPANINASVTGTVSINGGVPITGTLQDDTAPYIASDPTNYGVHILGVRNDTGAYTFTSANRAASPFAVDSSGRVGITGLGADVGVDGSGHTQPVSGTVTANQGGAPWSENITQLGGSSLSATAFMPVRLTDGSAYYVGAKESGGNLAAIASALAGTLTIAFAAPQHVIIDSSASITVSGTVAVGNTVVPGTGATNLGKAEDAAHASGDTGVASWAVRNDSGATTFGGDQDYSPIAVDSKGRVGVTLLGGSDLGVDGSGHTQPVSNAGLSNIDVALSTRTKPADQQHTIVDSGTLTAVTTITNPVTVTDGAGALNVIVDSSALPSGASTLAEQQTQTTSLGVIDDAFVAQGTTASTKIAVVGGKTNDGTPQYRELPEGAGGRSVIVEGVASGTAVPVSGTVTATIANLDVALSTRTKPADQQHVLLDANSGVDIGKLTADQSVNVTKISGTAASVNSGSKDNGTLRVVLATDQPALTNKLLVTPDSVALPANQSVNVNQLAGTTTSVNNGTADAGTLRVTVASDTTGVITVKQSTAANLNATVSPVLASSSSTDGVCTSVAANTTVLASSATRLGAVIHAQCDPSACNTDTVFIKLAATATTADYPLAPGESLNMTGSSIYTGIIDAIANSGTQKVCVLAW